MGDFVSRNGALLGTMDRTSVYGLASSLLFNFRYMGNTSQVDLSYVFRGSRLFLGLYEYQDIGYDNQWDVLFEIGHFLITNPRENIIFRA